jgi:hypothetical protein
MGSLLIRVDTLNDDILIANGFYLSFSDGHIFGLFIAMFKVDV